MFILDGMGGVGSAGNAGQAQPVAKAGEKPEVETGEGTTKTATTQDEYKIHTAELAKILKDPKKCKELIGSLNAAQISLNPQELIIGMTYIIQMTNEIKKLAESDPEIAKVLKKLETSANSPEAQTRYKKELELYEQKMKIYQEEIKAFNLSPSDKVPQPPQKPTSPEESNPQTLYKRSELFAEAIKDQQKTIKAFNDFQK